MEAMRLALINSLLSDVLLIRPDFVHQITNYLMSDQTEGSFAASLGKDWQIKEVKNMTNIAIVSIHGLLMRNPGPMERFMFGAINTDDIKNQIGTCLSESSIDGIILDIDSPGGFMTGPPALAEFIYQARAIKPILAHTSGQMCSAAMWVGSAAHIRTAFPASFIGSIGVWREHLDWSGFYDKIGIKATMISSGRNKVRGACGYPLSEDDLKYIQERTHEAYAQFTSAESKYLNIPVEKIVNEIGADVYFAEKSKSLGLIDKVATIEESLQIIAQLIKSTNPEEGMEILRSAYAINDEPVLRIEKITYEEVCACA